MHIILDRIKEVTPDEIPEIVNLIKSNKLTGLTDPIKLQALNLAANKKLSSIVAALIEIGVDLSVQLDSGESLLTYALKELLQYKSIQPLLERKLIDNEIISIKNSMNVEVNLNKIDNKIQKTPLMKASMEGNLIRVKALLELGASIDTRYNTMSQCKTALMLAAIEGHEEIVRYLLSKGANVHIKTIVREGVATSPKNILDLIGDQYGTNYDSIRKIITNAMNISPSIKSEEPNDDILRQQYRNGSKELIQMQNLLKTKKHSLELLQEQIRKFEILISEQETKLSKLREDINNRKHTKSMAIKIEESTNNISIQSRKRTLPEAVTNSITNKPLFFKDNKRQKELEHLDSTFNFERGVIDELDCLI